LAAISQLFVPFLQNRDYSEIWYRDILWQSSVSSIPSRQPAAGRA